MSNTRHTDFCRSSVVISEAMSNRPPGAPSGCGPSVDPLYHNLCDLDAAWGVAVEALAAAGTLACFVLLVFQAGIWPLVADARRRRMLPLQAAFTACTLGLFCLALAFVVGRDFHTCVARRFAFGVLFAGCFACLVTHGAWVTALGRAEWGEPRCGALYLGGLALWLVEVIINAEWLVITELRSPTAPPHPGPPDLPCRIANWDFVTALVYVMALLLAAVLTAVPALVQKDGRWRRDGALLLATALVSAAIWAAWASMILYGNRALGNPGWDDAAMAVALAANAWAFLVLYVIPQVCLLNQEGLRPEEGHQPDGDHPVYPGRRSLDYGPDQSQVQHDMFLDNAAFSRDEPEAEETPEDPYSCHLRRGVYQPTELALITKGLTFRDFQQNSGLQLAPAPRLSKESLHPPLSRESLPPPLI